MTDEELAARQVEYLAESAGKHAAKGAKSAVEGLAELFGTAPSHAIPRR
jgi:hypothetical protein